MRYNAANVVPGRYYYLRPEWKIDLLVEVVVEAGLLICKFFAGRKTYPVHELPSDAVFEEKHAEADPCLE